MGRCKGDHITGWVVVDKPEGPTSMAVVSRVRRLFNAAKAGHGGTLDPLASGILPVALGEATKVMRFVTEADKTYRFALRWGQETNTDDAMGTVVAESEVRPERARVEEALAGLAGVLEQTPPRYSAVRVNGRRAYDLARRGVETDLAPRPVRLTRAMVLAMPSPDETVMEVTCSKGFYVRALARDLGRMLGTYAHVTVLRRTRLGVFDESQSIPLDKLTALGHSEAAAPAPPALMAFLKPLSVALAGIPALTVSDRDAMRLRRGQAVLVRGRDAPLQGGAALAVAAGDPVALVEYAQGEIKPSRVFRLTG